MKSNRLPAISPNIREALLGPCLRAPIPFELARDFSTVFARFEHALKTSTFGRRSHGRYEINWHKLLDTVDMIDTAQLEFQQAISLLTTDPPHIQTSRYGWREEKLKGASSFAQAIDAARRVRNNLFHGSKHLSHSSISRNSELIYSSITVIQMCIEALPEIKTAYYSQE